MPPKIKRNNQRPYPKPRKNGKPKTRTIVKYVQAKQQTQPNVPRSFLGRAGLHVGDTISKVMGWGAYSVKQNSLWDGTLARQVPHMQNSSESIIFRHREYITDISSSTTFTTRRFTLNPGLDDTFPYLSNMARNFQEYRFRGLIFEYKSTSASALNSTNTALGTVALAIQYKSDASVYVNKQQMLNEMWAVDGKPAEDIILPVECDPSMTPIPIQYVRSASLAANQDPKLYDLGVMTVGAVGSQAVAVTGELWVSYEVEFHKPQLVNTLGYGEEVAHYNRSLSTAAAPFGSVAVSSFDNIGLTVNSTTITWPQSAQGKFLVLIAINGAPETIDIPTVTAVNITNMQVWKNSTNYDVRGPEPGKTVDQAMFGFVMEIVTPQLPTSYTWGNDGLYPSASNVDIVVVRMPQNYT